MSSFDLNNNDKNANEYYNVQAFYYNDYTKSVSPTYSEFDSCLNSDYLDYKEHIDVYIVGGLNNSKWRPCISMEYTGDRYVNIDNKRVSPGGINMNEGFDCKFMSETTFIEDDGYRGCIAFAWTNKSLGTDAVPEYAYGSNYNYALINNTDDIIAVTGNANALPTNGLLGASLAKHKESDNDFEGFSISLYSSEDFDTTEIVPYSTKLSHYIITYINSEGNISYFNGELAKCSDIYYDVYYGINTISVYPADDFYNFYLNGIYIASIESDQLKINNNSMSEYYFTASMIATRFTDANLKIMEINDKGENSMIYEHINNNNKYLTPEEKNNLTNLGVSVLNYYTEPEESEEKDYTEAFQTALLNNRRVYVPGGTYEIKGELVVRDNCELELAQDAVLEFDIPGAASTDKPAIGENTGIALWNNERIESAKKCITLNMLSSLVGNHATIRVPYDFDGIVIYASTRSHPTDDSLSAVEPFSAWDPQWKPGRYLKDINITKPIQQNEDNSIPVNKVGLHHSVDGGSNGTAVLIEGYRRTDKKGSTFIWGLEFTGLRIAGAFEYGIYGTNNWIMDVNEKGKEYMHWAWTNDMKIDGIIDGCECGVYLNHCNHAYISTSIQPRLSIKGDKYAKYGIYLNNCVNANLIGSRVWDWTNKLTHGGPELDPNDTENNIMYQHIRLDDDCYGLILDDFSYYEMDDYNIRDLIYTEYTNNFDTMSILQEPVSKFFSLNTDTTKSALFVDRKIDNETNPGEIITAYGMTATGMIYCGRNDENAIEITVNNIDFNGDSDSLIAFYDENYSHISNAAVSTDISVPTGAKYFRISCNTNIIVDNSSVTVNGNTISFRKNYLKDGIYVKNEYVE